MKAAILSINLHTRRLNYGAVLHSWFFQQLMLRRPDVESCEIIDYLPAALEGVNLKRWYLDGSTEKGLRFRLRDLCNTMAYLRRYARFERFFQRRLQVSAERYTQASLRAANLPYDVIFLESDVIWSPVYFRGRFDPAFFGALESMRNLQKIVYAASMGQAELTQGQKRELRGLLEAPDAISMRETYAARLVREQTDKPVADVVDPVLLAQIEDFTRIMSPRRVRGRVPAGLLPG